MTTRRSLAFLIALLLLPRPAHAQGFIDWLEKMSGPKLWGVGSDLHLLCVKDDGTPVRFCQRLITSEDLKFHEIRHIVDARVAFYWKYGERFSDVVDPRALHALRVEGMYHYRVSDLVQLGAGAGIMRFTGEGFDDALVRDVLTPVSLVLAPFSSGLARGLTLRFSATFITQGYSGVDFGNTQTRFSTNGEWNNSFGVGYELLRLK
jgi:hypothetical protein